MSLSPYKLGSLKDKIEAQAEEERKKLESLESEKRTEETPIKVEVNNKPQKKKRK